MRLRVKDLASLLLLCLSLCGLAQQNQGIQKEPTRFTLPAGVKASDYRQGIVILKLKPENGSATKVQSAVTQLSALKIAGVTIASVNKRFRGENAPAAGFSVLKATPDFGLDRIYELTYTGQADIVTVINNLMASGNLEYAEPDYIYHYDYLPNDPRYTAGNQAYLDVIKAPQAWDLARSATGVVIGIVDSGSDLNHEDLAANIYLNTKDPVNGIDDDNDGYVDNYYGWDMVGLSGSSIKEDNDPNVKSDTTQHGVHVSGLASAVGDNGKGISSVAFSAKLLIVKCGADNNGNSIYRGYDGIKYAADHGAQIINCSWGGSGGGSYGRDIVAYAIAKGCLVIAASGNDNVVTPSYPAAYPGVLAVSAVSNTDIRASYSNYGTYVGISAPGNTMWSTLPGNAYGTLSGTSMATPVVSSAAALLKAYVPSLTMEQVGERLKATSDNIEAKNPSYIGLLGKGRVNVFRALSESPPSIKYQKVTVQDKGNGSNPAGETMDVYLDIKNVLLPLNNVMLHLSTTSSAVTITTGDVSAGSFATNETKTLVGPFKVLVKAGVADNTAVNFKLDYASGSASSITSENFTITVSLDYLNIEVNQVSTTITSNGRVGYSLYNATNGLGLVYKGENLLFESGLMIGTSATRVSDNVRTGGSGANEHFVKTERVGKVAGTTAAFEAVSQFSDANNPIRLPVQVKHRQTAFATAPDDKYTIATYEITNTGSADLKNVYIGMFTDFDIGTGSGNITKYDALSRLAYVCQKSGNSLYAGVKLLTTTSPPAYYPISYMVSGDLTADNNFSVAEKFTTLSSGIKANGLGESSAAGYDVMFTAGYGPYDIPSGATVTVAFAYLAGDNLADLQASGEAAQNKYEIINPGSNVNKFVLYQNYPNPVTANTVIPYDVPKTGNVELSLYNLSGQKVRTYLDEPVAAGTHTFVLNSTDLTNGIYIYRMKYGDETQSIKLWVAR